MNDIRYDVLHMLLINKLGGSVTLTAHDFAGLHPRTKIVVEQNDRLMQTTFRLEKPPVILDGSFTVVDVRDVAPA
ncbi:MAG: hypothetical protein KKA05_10510 [Alphaproteobacteria bacterium]|nr:hypothetical protein [Alphaproteobacteria bacterium]